MKTLYELIMQAGDNFRSLNQVCATPEIKDKIETHYKNVSWLCVRNDAMGNVFGGSTPEEAVQALLKSLEHNVYKKDPPDKKSLFGIAIMR